MSKQYIDLVETKYLCPSCKQRLHSHEDSPKSRGIWCSRKECDNVGANEGAHGKNDLEAYAMFATKMGVNRKK